MRDSYNDQKHAVAIAAASYTADQAGSLVDLLGFDAATISLAIGAGGITFSGTNKIEFVLQHGDAADGSDLAAVTSDAVLGVTVTGSGIVKSLTAAHASADVTKIGYVGGKRYVKLTADFSGTHGTGTPIAATAVLSHAASRPVA